ncbi:hypothetical protein IMZ11_24595 [Microtetraspora sp. AC03309]|uniref:hypothetical protein n=1 Tax=Microtetraspora sp. AC03309 TaxID=2779376 RepID=UPI001E390897|nr:hypothetical protein [Microtetraspora sp. AC03309]MCC5578810.1 hypothetical protein [Microtetraspora sp. AC03309]
MSVSGSHLTDDQASAIREAVAEAMLAACEQGRKGLDNDPDAHLLMVAASSVAAQETSRLLRQSITGARTAGHSWETLGRLLGISRQAAQQRFGTSAADRKGSVPGDTPTHRMLTPLHAFNEMEALEREGLRGWHAVDYGYLFHLVEASPHKWEHRRLWWPSRRRRRLMEEQGWELIVPSDFDSPWAYYKRRLNEPAEPADRDCQ